MRVALAWVTIVAEVSEGVGLREMMLLIRLLLVGAVIRSKKVPEACSKVEIIDMLAIVTVTSKL